MVSDLVGLVWSCSPGRFSHRWTRTAMVRSTVESSFPVSQWFPIANATYRKSGNWSMPCFTRPVQLSITIFTLDWRWKCKCHKTRECFCVAGLRPKASPRFLTSWRENVAWRTRSVAASVDNHWTQGFLVIVIMLQFNIIKISQVP